VRFFQQRVPYVNVHFPFFFPSRPGGVTEFGAIGAQVLLDLQKKFDFNELATSYLYDKYQALYVHIDLAHIQLILHIN
jgi:hypothetical protein